jgi:hypothetical protein
VSGRRRVSAAALLTGYDFELPIRDALDNPELDPTRRALGVLGMGTGLDDGHFAALELAEAAAQLTTDRAGGVPDAAGQGAARLCTILDAPCDDYQRALWHAVSRCAPEAAAGHLEWLAELMRTRAGMWRVIQATGAYMPLLPRAGNDAGSAQFDRY